MRIANMATIAFVVLVVFVAAVRAYEQGIVPTVSKADSTGSHQLYLLYAVRNGPQGPVPVYMVSEPVEVTVAPTTPPATTSERTAAPSTQPSPVTLDGLGLILQSTLDGEWEVGSYLKGLVDLGPNAWME